jgi:hypothetical protein
VGGTLCVVVVLVAGVVLGRRAYASRASQKRRQRLVASSTWTSRAMDVYGVSAPRSAQELAGTTGQTVIVQYNIVRPPQPSRR